MHELKFLGLQIQAIYGCTMETSALPPTETALILDKHFPPDPRVRNEAVSLTSSEVFEVKENIRYKFNKIAIPLKVNFKKLNY